MLGEQFFECRELKGVMSLEHVLEVLHQCGCCSIVVATALDVDRDQQLISLERLVCGEQAFWLIEHVLGQQQDDRMTRLKLDKGVHAFWPDLAQLSQSAPFLELLSWLVRLASTHTSNRIADVFQLGEPSLGKAGCGLRLHLTLALRLCKSSLGQEGCGLRLYRGLSLRLCSEGHPLRKFLCQFCLFTCELRTLCCAHRRIRCQRACHRADGGVHMCENIFDARHSVFDRVRRRELLFVHLNARSRAMRRRWLQRSLGR
mmetsp:Transcript_25798/g.68244  ORF Transcript_25798/g.68244 Transcript_25798/m.68244 type:complete len:259 (-) Transcript_25798:803-1579(-)